MPLIADVAGYVPTPPLPILTPLSTGEGLGVRICIQHTQIFFWADATGCVPTTPLPLFNSPLYWRGVGGEDMYLTHSSAELNTL